MREMADSGLVEFGSHTHDMHNPDTAGAYVEGGANGVAIGPGEGADEHAAKVRADLEKSIGRLRDELDVEPVCFAYPFGAHDRATDRVVDSLFPVSLLTDGRSFFGGFRGYLDNSGVLGGLFGGSLSLRDLFDGSLSLRDLFDGSLSLRDLFSGAGRYHRLIRINVLETTPLSELLGE